MVDKNLKIYKLLYYRNGNNDRYFDYNVHLNLYKNYLLSFYDIELQSKFYMNIEFLSYVVYGFCYFHDHFIDDQNDFSNELLEVSLQRYFLLKNKIDYDSYSIDDVIFSLSWLCVLELKKINCIEDNIETSRCLLDNNCRINKVMQKKINEGM